MGDAAELKSFDIQPPKKQHVQVQFGLSFDPIELELQRGFGFSRVSNVSRNTSLFGTNPSSSHGLGNRSVSPVPYICSNSHVSPGLIYVLLPCGFSNRILRLVQRSIRNKISDQLLQGHEPPGCP